MAQDSWDKHKGIDTLSKTSTSQLVQSVSQSVYWRACDYQEVEEEVSKWIVLLLYWECNSNSNSNRAAAVSGIEKEI